MASFACLKKYGCGFVPFQAMSSENQDLDAVMKRCRAHVFYSGHVQGVGFRYTVLATARGFDVSGTVRNLADGRVELVAEGTKEELEAFRHAIRDSGLGRLIRNEDVAWEDAHGSFRGFEIVS